MSEATNAATNSEVTSTGNSFPTSCHHGTVSTVAQSSASSSSASEPEASDAGLTTYDTEITNRITVDDTGTGGTHRYQGTLSSYSIECSRRGDDRTFSVGLTRMSEDPRMYSAHPRYHLYNDNGWTEMREAQDPYEAMRLAGRPEWVKSALEDIKKGTAMETAASIADSAYEIAEQEREQAEAEKRSHWESSRGSLYSKLPCSRSSQSQVSRHWRLSSKEVKIWNESVVFSNEYSTGKSKWTGKFSYVPERSVWDRIRRKKPSAREVTFSWKATATSPGSPGNEESMSSLNAPRGTEEDMAAKFLYLFQKQSMTKEACQ